MLGSYLKKVFSKKESEPKLNEKFYSTLRIAMHSTVNLQTVDWLLLTGEIHQKFTLPSGSLVVDAIGETKIDQDTLFKIYLSDLEGEDSYILNLYECKSIQDNSISITESTLFQVINTIVPETEASWDQHMANIGFKTIEIDEHVYNRDWGDDFTEKADFSEFKENVHTAANTIDYTNNYLLYSRITELSDEKERLIVGIEETADTAEIVMMVGLNIHLSNIEVV